MPYLNISARLKDKPDQGMLTAKGGSSYPYTVIMDASGTVLTRLRPTSEKAINEALKRANISLRLRTQLTEKPDHPSAKAGLELLDALTTRKPPTLAEADRLAATEGLDPELKAIYKKGRAAFRDKLNYIRVGRALIGASQAMRSGTPRDEAYRQRDATLLKLYREGVRLPGSSRRQLDFIQAVISGAVEAKDLDLASKLLPGCEKAYEARVNQLNKSKWASPRRLKGMSDRMEALRQKLKQAQQGEQGEKE